VGYIDLVIRRARPDPDLAIEIDSADKQWSLTKLRYAASAGMHPIWVRWGDEEWAGYYDDVDVIQLPETRRGASRLVGTAQLTFWSPAADYAAGSRAE
jgi:hypothetical protein